MRRTILLALVAALLVVPNALAAGPTTEILRDCADDGILQGSYTVAQLRSARDNVPAELNEYSDCKDVLSRAIEDKTVSHSSSSGGGPTGGGGGGGSSSGGTPSSGSSAPSTTTNPGSAPTPDATTTPDPDAVLTPKTPADYAALGYADAQAGKTVEVDGRSLSPTSARFRADIGRNALPTMLIIVLALLSALALAFVAPTAGRRVLARRQP